MKIIVVRKDTNWLTCIQCNKPAWIPNTTMYYHIADHCIHSTGILYHIKILKTRGWISQTRIIKVI